MRAHRSASNTVDNKKVVCCNVDLCKYSFGIAAANIEVEGTDVGASTLHNMYPCVFVCCLLLLNCINGNHLLGSISTAHMSLSSISRDQRLTRLQPSSPYKCCFWTKSACSMLTYGML